MPGARGAGRAGAVAAIGTGQAATRPRSRRVVRRANCTPPRCLRPPVTLLGLAYAVVFPGQGSQFIGMADGWASDPAGKAVLDEASEAIGRDVIAGCHDEEALATTEFVQPALLACDIAAFEVMRDDGAVDPVGVAGHSLGEFAALVAGGAMSFRDALELVVIRGVAMQRAGEDQPGGMTALLGIGSADAEQLCAEVRRDGVLVVANENSPVQVVASGSRRSPSSARSEPCDSGSPGRSTAS